MNGVVITDHCKKRFRRRFPSQDIEVEVEKAMNETESLPPSAYRRLKQKSAEGTLFLHHDRTLFIMVGNMLVTCYSIQKRKNPRTFKTFDFL